MCSGTLRVVTVTFPWSWHGYGTVVVLSSSLVSLMLHEGP